MSKNKFQVMQMMKERAAPEYSTRPVMRVINDLFVNDLTMKLLGKET